jgi:ABC-type multidrug transport system fused ATPase/permease subunit
VSLWGQLNIRWLRSQIGVVSQEPVLFNKTIAQNIAMGKPGASKHEIHEAARAANAHDFIMRLPKGYDTIVGQRGTQACSVIETRSAQCTSA